jgi:cysteine desulfurase
VKVSDLGVDLLTVAGHKFYAPKGVGVLFIRRGLRIEPLIHGAGHEGARRAGTENVPGIVGIGKAAEIATETIAEDSRRLFRLREHLYQGIKEKVNDVKLNGHPEQKLPNTLNLSFWGLEGTALLEHAAEIGASLGSACHDKTREVSPVLRAMGVEEDFGFGAVRFSLGRFTTEQEIDRAIKIITKSVGALRSGM